MNSYHILGFGRFGKLAASRLREKEPDARVTVVEGRHDSPGQGAAAGFRFVWMDAVDYLCKNPLQGADWIVPAVPVHVAYEWVRRKVESTGRLTPIPVPEAVAELLPNPFRGDDGQVFSSIADFLCPDDCPEPQDRCTVTSEPRPVDLLQRLTEMDIAGYRSIVVKSLSLAPGVGGYPFSALQGVLKEILTVPGPVLLSTACRCHGVVHAFGAEMKL